jgi:hypothetical protein
MIPLPEAYLGAYSVQKWHVARRLKLPNSALPCPHALHYSIQKFRHRPRVFHRFVLNQLAQARLNFNCSHNLDFFFKFWKKSLVGWITRCLSRELDLVPSEIVSTMSSRLQNRFELFFWRRACRAGGHDEKGSASDGNFFFPLASNKRDRRNEIALTAFSLPIPQRCLKKLSPTHLALNTRSILPQSGTGCQHLRPTSVTRQH